ncbi:MAG: aldehyde dehydrogenase family protein [Phycisphaerae bacterium]|jgi:acyl-CoA reductase-like NAD-dependent aldehyde dehydrogenase
MASTATPAPAIEPKPLQLRIKPGFAWHDVLSKAVQVAPEAFSDQGHFLNLIEGSWGTPGHPRSIASPIDGSIIGKLPMIDLPDGLRAVRAAAKEGKAWAKVSLDERKSRVRATVDEMRTNRELLGQLLMWEIGKPWHLALADADRCIEGVAWYVDNIDGMIAGRTPLGLVSNIASWNYPLSVLQHAVLVQILCGNASIAKAPTDGGGTALAVSMAIARRHGLPVSFVSGSGGTLSDALVRNDHVDCLSFVGGRSNGRDVASALVDTGKRHMLEMEGVNAYGVWEFSQWDLLAKQLKKGFEYGKQRCTAYPRFVVQRSLLPKFLDMYFGVVKSVKFGHPALVANDNDPLPQYEFGPMINAKKVEELKSLWSEAIGAGGVPLYQGEVDARAFLPGQDISAYFAPATLLNIPRSCKLYFNEPFGPLDLIVTVDRIEELVAEMNVSNGNLVSSLATDDEVIAKRLQGEVRAFKFGHNVVRSRGDREELFGGLGQSWKGCFVGGSLLARSLTRGEGDDKLPGVFPTGTRLP